MAENRSMSQKRMELLSKLAEITSECYNANIQNYGPGGIWENEGRSFGYPIRFDIEIPPDIEASLRKIYSNSDEQTKLRLKKALKRESFTESVADAKKNVDVFVTGHFAFGANELPIIYNLDKVLRYLEKHHGLEIDEQGG